MAQITPDWLSDKRKLIEGEIKRLEGALEMLAMVEEQIATLTTDDLAQMTGAQSVEVIPNEKGGDNGL